VLPGRVFVVFHALLVGQQRGDERAPFGRSERAECLSPRGRATGQPRAGGRLPFAGDADDPAPAVVVVLAPLEDSLAAELADHEAHRGRRDLQVLGQVVHRHRTVEQEVGQQRQVPRRQREGLDLIRDRESFRAPDQAGHQQQQRTDRVVGAQAGFFRLP
jgi:hypothetical protein